MKENIGLTAYITHSKVQLLHLQIAFKIVFMGTLNNFSFKAFLHCIVFTFFTLQPKKEERNYSLERIQNCYSSMQMQLFDK